MPVEIIGEAGAPGPDREWISAECELAISTSRPPVHERFRVHSYGQLPPFQPTHFWIEQRPARF